MELLESLELIGPGRWLDRPVIDLRLQFSPADLQLLEQQAGPVLRRLESSLQAAGIEPVFAAGNRTGTSSTQAAYWLAQAAVLLQRQAGHRVSWSDAEAETGQGTVHARFEAEDPTTGTEAGELALWLLDQALQPAPGDPHNPGITERLARFSAAAELRVFPPDAELLMAVAQARDIPVCKLDREPWEPIIGEFRRRPNGLLRFGHACHQQIVDGTLCLERSAKVIRQLSSNESVATFLRQQGAAFNRENLPAGQTCRFLCAGQQLLAVVNPDGGEVTDHCHPSWLEKAALLAQHLELGMLVLEADAVDVSRPLQSTAGFAGLDISPQLDSLMIKAPALAEMMAEDFVHWMFPPGAPSRIPLFSVTGTNGKTTTCRMLRAIAREAGFRVGMACTDGIYLNDELIEAGDSSGRDGHFRVLESRQVNLGVLETARGGVLHSGFTFDHSDVAICTNISAEHLGEYGIHSVEDMAEVKQLVLDRARKAVGLNFDDALVRHMTAPPGARTCWTTLLAGPGDIQALGLPADRVLFLSVHAGEEWITSSEGNSQHLLLPVAALPATFTGKARHNLSNAMQAMAAALELGIEWPVIKAAMSAFEMSIENTPGRLNYYQGPEFDVLIDFVQNYACLEQLCACTDRLDIRGKRILVMSVLGRHPDETVLEFARLASRKFDRFICRNYAKTFPHRSKEEIPEMLRAELLRCGVPEEYVSIELDEEPAIDRALRMATPGDLVVILCGLRSQQIWQQVTDFTAFSPS